MWHLKDLHSTSHATMAIYYVIHSHLYWVNMFFGPRRLRHHNDDGGSDLQRVEKYGFFHNIWQQNKSHLAVTGEYHVETLVWIIVGIPRVAGYQTGAGVTNYPVNTRYIYRCGYLAGVGRLGVASGEWAMRPLPPRNACVIVWCICFWRFIICSYWHVSWRFLLQVSM